MTTHPADTMGCQIAQLLIRCNVFLNHIDTLDAIFTRSQDRVTLSKMKTEILLYVVDLNHRHMEPEQLDIITEYLDRVETILLAD